MPGKDRYCRDVCQRYGPDQGQRGRGHVIPQTLSARVLLLTSDFLEGPCGNCCRLLGRVRIRPKRSLGDVVSNTRWDLMVGQNSGALSSFSSQLAIVLGNKIVGDDAALTNLGPGLMPRRPRLMGHRRQLHSGPSPIRMIDLGD